MDSCFAYRCIVSFAHNCYFFAPSRNCFDFFLRLLPRPPAHSTHNSTMQDQKLLSALLLTAVIFLISTEYTLSCNRSLCASQVSKCLLTQSCKCEMKGSKNCTCCKDCYNCLSWLWEECCSCVGKTSFRWKTQLEIPQTFHVSLNVTDLCPTKPTQSTKSPLSKHSHYEEIEGIPGLFNALLEDEDDKWSVFTFPVDYDSSLYGAKSKESFYIRKFSFFVTRARASSIDR